VSTKDASGRTRREEKMGAQTRRRFYTSHELSLIVILSAIGGGVSVPIGHASNLLNAVPFLPFGTPQAVSGLHVIWILLAGVLIRKPGSSAVTGALKGLVELVLFSRHSVLVLLISAVEGAVMDVSLAILGRRNRASLYLSSGLSSSSNVLVLWLVVLRRLPLAVIAYMYAFSFASGALFAGYLARRALEIIWGAGLGEY
jgi:ABC-type thiamin/hydroxymethylpyrimidine transport system permease subunit